MRVAASRRIEAWHRSSEPGSGERCADGLRLTRNTSANPVGYAYEGPSSNGLTGPGVEMKQRLTTFLTIVTAMVVAVGGAAMASEAVEDIVDDGEETTLTRPVIEAVFDNDIGGVKISIQTEDGVDPCAGLKLDRDPNTGEVILVPDDAAVDPDADVDPDAPVDADEAAEATEYPGCLAYDGTGKDGKVTHGTMQSMVAKNLSPHDLDIPKGWIMREVAKERPEKVKAKDALKDEGPESSTDDDDQDDEDKDDDEDTKGPKQGKAKGHDREKKGKGARGG